MRCIKKMTYSLQSLPEAEDDIIKSYIWYKTKSEAPGEDFIRIFMLLRLIFQRIHCCREKE